MTKNRINRVKRAFGRAATLLPFPRSRGDASRQQLKTENRKLKTVLFLLPFAFFSAACRQDMHDQPKYESYEKSDFFRDGQASRQPVENTIARGQLRDDRLFYTGKNAQAGAVAASSQSSTGGGEFSGFSASLPFPVTKEVLDRGQDRYNIYCSVCHDRAGYGDGMVVRRGFKRPPSFHDERLRNAPVGYFYDVMTNGFGAMQDYSAQVTPRDRWAIAAYLRALQLSQNQKFDELSPEGKQKVQEREAQGQNGKGEQRQ